MIGDRPDHRRHRRAHVLPDLPAGGEHPMSAAPLELSALAVRRARKQAHGAVPCSRKPPSPAPWRRPRPAGSRRASILARESGLSGAAYARALAAAFDYRYVDAEELALMEPDFAKLAPAEATRRNCLVVHEDEHAAGGLRRSVRRHAARLARAAPPRSPAMGARRARGARQPHGAARRGTARHRRSAAGYAAGASSASRGSTLSRTSPSARTRARWCGWCTRRSTTRCAAAPATFTWRPTPADSWSRYRLDGVLVNIAPVPGVELAEQVISRIKVMSELDIAERRVPQDGRFKIVVRGPANRFSRLDHAQHLRRGRGAARARQEGAARR